MKILFVGDPHLRINKFSLAMEFIGWLDKLIEEQRPDLVVNLGDSLDTHAVIRSEVLNELMKHIYRVLDQGIPYVYLKGNHDQYTPKDSRYHAMLSFKGRIENLFIVDAIQDLFGMTFVPFLADNGAFPTETRSICIAHQTFLGADYGAVNAEDGVDPDKVSADVIISGHIHKMHTLGKVQYVGSPFAQDASDVNQIKGITVFDSDTFKRTFFQCPLPSWRSFSFEIGIDGSVEELHYGLSAAMTGTKDHWVVELRGPKAEIVNYLDSDEYGDLNRSVSIKLKTVFTDKHKQKVSIRASSMDQVVREFVEKVYSGALDKKVLLSRADAILKEVRSQTT